jgi:electron transport complex protein RnfB
MSAVSIDQINALLPQTQCRRCGFEGCRPYAEAIQAGVADINRCPPGGDDGIVQLAALLGVATKALDSALEPYLADQIATIVESDCIGCAKCLAACPVDAIIGAPKFMHTVVADECTGCELCLPPCPVDCITMILSPPALNVASKQSASHYQKRYEAHSARMQAQVAAKAEQVRRQKQMIRKAGC